MYTSSQDKNVLPGGSNINFSIKLPNFITLEGSWSIALAEINTPKRKKDKEALPDMMDLICPQLESSTVANGDLVSILRRIPMKSSNRFAFRKLLYRPLNKTTFSHLTFRIQSVNGDDNKQGIKDLQGAFEEESVLYLTLIFKKTSGQ